MSALIAVLHLGGRGAHAAGGNLRVSFEGAVQCALLNNLDLRAARYAVDQARARLKQAGRWTNPEIEASGTGDFAFANKGEAAFTAGLYQNFPVTSRLGLAREICRLDVERALREIRNHERLLIHRVQSQYIRVVAGREKAALWKQIEARHAAMEEITRKSLEAGQGTAVEKALATAMRSTAWNNLNAEETAAALELIELKTLLGLPAAHPLEITDSLTSIAGALENRTSYRPKELNRPDADLLLLGADRAALEERLARAEAWEGLRIGVEYTNDRNVDAPEGMGTDQFLGLKISIPLPLWNSNQGTAAEKKALRDEMQSRADALKLEMANSLAAGLREVELLKRRSADIRHRALGTLQAAEQEIRNGFEEGRADLRDWLAIRTQLSELELARVAATAELALASAKLLALTGGHPAFSSSASNSSVLKPPHAP